MEKQIIQLLHEENKGEIEILLQEKQGHEIAKMIEDYVARGKGEILPLLRAVLLGLQSSKVANKDKILAVYKKCITLIENGDFAAKSSSNVLGLMIMEADSLPVNIVMELVDVFMDLIKTGNTESGKSLELFPKLLSIAAVEEYLVVGGNSMKGSEYKNHILNTLCCSRWNPKSVIHLATMFKDVNLLNDELKFVIEKIVRMMKEMELADLPALIYQLLLLAAKGHKKVVIEGITEFFIQQDNLHRQKLSSTNELSEDLMDDDNGEILRQIEGTVILHISFAVKLDQDLGREFLKFLKSKQQGCATLVLAPFNLALALALSGIHRFEDQIFDFLKSTILKSFKDSEKQQQSSWVKEIVSSSSNVESLVLESVHNSVHGWDHVVQGLVHLGFLLMDTYGPKAAFGRIETASHMQNTPNRKASALGSKILIATFKAHDAIRVDVLEQIFNRVITKASAPVHHFMDLLSKTVMSAPQILLESSNKVREMFDYLSYLSPTSADELLKAVIPLLKLSLSLKDSLMIVLRKSMFSRQLEARKIGVNGFLMILKHFRVLGGLPSSQLSQTISSSQVQVDVHARCNPAGNEALCLEILGNLRRVLSQQADVRMIFYQGIYEVMCRNTKLQGPILELLLSQLLRCYESSTEVNPPVKLHLCISTQGEKIFLQEPLAHLVCCIQQCLLKANDTLKRQEDEENENMDEMEDFLFQKAELEKLMTSFVDRMIQSEMDDFELDKSADFTTSSGVGIKNNLFAILVLGLYEALMEYVFLSKSLCVDSAEKTLKLFQNYYQLSNVLKEKVNNPAGKKSKSNTFKSPQSLMSLKCVNLILDFVIKEAAPRNREAVLLLAENWDFRKHVMTVALQKIHQVQEKGFCEGPEGKDDQKLFPYFSSLASLFLQFYIENQSTGEEGRRERIKALNNSSLEGLVGIISVITQKYEEDITEFLKNMMDVDDKTEFQDVLYAVVKKFQKLVVNLLSLGDENICWKELGHLLNIVHKLCQKLPASSPQFEKVLGWIHRLSSDQSIDDIPTSKMLLGILLAMTSQSKDCCSLLREMSQDIHSQLGDVDQEIEVEDKTHFALITHRTAAPTVFMLVLQHIEKELDDTDWVVNRLKADIGVVEEQDDICTQREGHEKSVCTRLGILVNSFHELVQSAIPVGVCMENIVKQATRLYGTLTVVVKYFIALYVQKVGHLTARFEKLVKLIGINLTQQCYSMITYIQQTESEQVQQTTEKNKKDKKKLVAAAQAGKAKALKQSKIIPNLIFSIETFEKYLIQLSKKSKVNLMEHIKLSTSRDFRINFGALQNLDEDEDDNEEDENDDVTMNQEDNAEENDQEISSDGVDHDVSENQEEVMEVQDSDENQENEEPTHKKKKKESSKAKKTMNKVERKKLPKHS